MEKCKKFCVPRSVDAAPAQLIVIGRDRGPPVGPVRGVPMSGREKPVTRLTGSVWRVVAVSPYRRSQMRLDARLIDAVAVCSRRVPFDPTMASLTRGSHRDCGGERHRHAWAECGGLWRARERNQPLGCSPVLRARQKSVQIWTCALPFTRLGTYHLPRVITRRTMHRAGSPSQAVLKPR